MFAYCLNNPITGYDPTGTWDWGGVIAGLAIFAVGSASLILTVATAGAASPFAAAAISVGGTIVSAATCATGVVVANAAAIDGTIVSDFTYTVGGERKGVSIVTDFKNDTCELYTHAGAGTSDSMGLSYSTGHVYNYNDLGDYSGDFVEGGLSGGGFSFSYSQDPNKKLYTGCYAYCFGFSTPGAVSGGLSYDYFIPVHHFAF